MSSSPAVICIENRTGRENTVTSRAGPRSGHERKASGVAMTEDARSLRARLEHGEASAAEAVQLLGIAAAEAPTRGERLEACRLLGDLAGRSLGAEWEIAERAA